MENDRELLVTGLQMRMNYIQTGDPCLCSVDAANQGLPGQALTIEQMQLIIRMDQLIQGLRNAPQFVV